jgi:opacity protein-like surface antigen
MKKNIYAAIIVSAMFSSPLMANSGFYINGSLGASDLYGTEEVAKKDYLSESVEGGYGFSLKISGGYEFNDFWGIEIAYANHDTIKIDGFDTDSYSVYALGVGKYPLSDRINIFSKLGFNYTESTINIAGFEYSIDNTSLAYGTGIEFIASETISVTAEYLGSGTGGDEVSSISAFYVGLTYRF